MQLKNKVSLTLSLTLAACASPQFKIAAGNSTELAQLMAVSP